MYNKIVILENRDVIGASQTGTGKTAAFALPTLSKLELMGKPQCLVLEPTRELAHQVSEQFEHYGKHTGFNVALLHGGVGYGTQVAALEKGADIVVATPGRLIDMFYRGIMRFGQIKVLILDEVDRMLDMGFLPDVKKIVNVCPWDERQALGDLDVIDCCVDCRECTQYLFHWNTNLEGDIVLGVKGVRRSHAPGHPDLRRVVPH